MRYNVKDSTNTTTLLMGGTLRNSKQIWNINDAKISKIFYSFLIPKGVLSTKINIYPHCFSVFGFAKWGLKNKNPKHYAKGVGGISYDDGGAEFKSCFSNAMGAFFGNDTNIERLLCKEDEYWGKEDTNTPSVSLFAKSNVEDPQKGVLTCCSRLSLDTFVTKETASEYKWIGNGYNIEVKETIRNYTTSLGELRTFFENMKKTIMGTLKKELEHTTEYGTERLK
jgi:hypothetical protein